jgi:hypothetical protein
VAGAASQLPRAEKPPGGGQHSDQQNVINIQIRNDRFSRLGNLRGGSTALVREIEFPTVKRRQEMISYRSLVVAVSLPAMIASSSAYAGGFLADVFVRPISPEAADALDKAHKDIGNPLDHTANGAAGAIVGAVTGNPAIGAGVTTALEAKDAANRNK